MILTGVNTNNDIVQNIYEFVCKNIDGKRISLSNYKNKVLLIVNTASQCGFTPQYEGLEELQRKYSSQGFTVLGFPCNQFGSQEPGDEKQIQEFCETKYQTSFPLFKKIDVNGFHSIPLFYFLKSQARGILGTKAIKWNFTKFLINRDGEVIKRFAPLDKPHELERHIESLL